MPWPSRCLLATIRDSPSSFARAFVSFAATAARSAASSNNRDPSNNERVSVSDTCLPPTSFFVASCGSARASASAVHRTDACASARACRSRPRGETETATVSRSRRFRKPRTDRRGRRLPSPSPLPRRSRSFVRKVCPNPTSGFHSSERTRPRRRPGRAASRRSPSRRARASASS